VKKRNALSDTMFNPRQQRLISLSTCPLCNLYIDHISYLIVSPKKVDTQVTTVSVENYFLHLFWFCCVYIYIHILLLLKEEYLWLPIDGPSENTDVSAEPCLVGFVDTHATQYSGGQSHWE
jgi:hypothetical protein